MRLLTRVDPKVPNQVTGPQKSLTARLADVRFLARVDQHVHGKASGPQEGLAARVADVRFFALARLAAEGKAYQENALHGAGLKEQA